MNNIVLYPAADADADRQASWFAKTAGLDLALRFLTALQATLDRISEYPDIGARTRFEHPAIAGCRFVPVDGFEKILIFFRFDSHRILVIRVLHGSREIDAVL